MSKKFRVKIVGENKKFKTFSCLKTKFETNKTTKGNIFTIDLFKMFLVLKICEIVKKPPVFYGPVLKNTVSMKRLGVKRYFKHLRNYR